MSKFEQKVITATGSSVTLLASFANQVIEASKEGFVIDSEHVKRVPRSRGTGYIHCIMTKGVEFPEEEQAPVISTEIITPEDEAPKEEHLLEGEESAFDKVDSLELLKPITKAKDLREFAEDVGVEIPDSMKAATAIKKKIKEELEIRRGQA